MYRRVQGSQILSRKWKLVEIELLLLRFLLQPLIENAPILFFFLENPTKYSSNRETTTISCLFEHYLASSPMVAKNVKSEKNGVER